MSVLMFYQLKNTLLYQNLKFHADSWKTLKTFNLTYVCYQFRILRNLRIDIKDRLEEYSQSIEIDIHDCTQS